MIRKYIDAVMARARYEIIRDEEPFYGEVSELQGVWASGKTLEECRRNLAEVVDGWVLVRLARGFPIPSLGDVTLAPPGEMSVA
jgi:predicted RNase H-like HicB family nuclease